MSALFSNFPKIYYNGQVARNLIVKSVFLQKVIDNASSFYPYTVKNNERADMIAYNYYGSSDFVWLVWMSNQIIDPYFGWPMTDNELYDFVRNKYGSIEDAQTQIIHYKYNPDVDPADEDRMYKETLLVSPTTYAQMSIIDKSYFDIPVYAFDWEQEQNEAKRTIKLIDNDLTALVEKEIARIFK